MAGKKKSPAKRVAIVGVFTAVAMIFSYVEAMIPFNFGVPGIKLGLANLMVVSGLYFLGVWEVALIMMLRIALSSMLFGNMSAFIYSLAGGVLSFLVMLLLKKIKGFSMPVVSAVGGVAHNIGQILVAMLVIENIGILYYLPILMISGLVTGLLIGIGGKQVIRFLKHTIS